MTKRLDGESFEDYKKRRAIENKILDLRTRKGIPIEQHTENRQTRRAKLYNHKPTGGTDVRN